MVKRVLIIGGAGFIGYPLAQKLSANKHSVIILDNLSNPSKDFSSESLSIPFVFDDISNSNGALNECIYNFQPNVIIHLAAYHFIPSCNKYPKKTKAVNVIGTRHILNAIRDFSQNTRIIFASSAAVYTPSHRSHTENSSNFPTDIYGKTKKDVELLIRKYANAYGIEFTILRLFNVFGSGDNTPHLIPNIIKQFKQNSSISLGNTESKRDYIYIDDVVDGFLQIIKKCVASKNEVFNIGTGTSHSAKEIVTITNEILSSTYIPLPIIIDKKKMRPMDRPHLRADINKIKRVLKWAPKMSLRTGLELLIKKEEVIESLHKSSSTRVRVTLRVA